MEEVSNYQPALAAFCVSLFIHSAVLGLLR